MEIAFWLVIIFALVYEPIVGYFDFRKFKLAVKTNENARSRYYIHSIIGLWVPAIFILLLAAFTDLTYGDIGLTWPTINTETLGPVVTYIVLGIACLYLLVILYYLIGYHYSAKIRKSIVQAKEMELEKAGFSEILPTIEKEKKVVELRFNHRSHNGGNHIQRVFNLCFSLFIPQCFNLAHYPYGLITVWSRPHLSGLVRGYKNNCFWPHFFGPLHGFRVHFTPDGSPF